MSTKILQYLSYYFYIIGKKESIINNSRRELIRQDNFYAPQLFNHLDKEKKEFLSLKDFKAFITFNYKEESLRKFIHVFDKDNNFAIDIYEFCNLVGADPNDNKEDVDVNETPSEKIISLCMNIIQAEIDLVDLCGDLVARIIKAPGFSTYEAFLAIDNKQKKFIDNENLSLFLKEYGYSDDDVDCIIWRLDTDQDRRLCIEEFRDMFTTFNYDANAKSVTELKEILDEMFTDNENDNENNENNNAEFNRVEDVDDIIINDDYNNNEIINENNSKTNTDNIENNNNKRNSNIDVDEVVMNNEEDNNDINDNNNNKNQDNFNNNFNEESADNNNYNKNYNNNDNYNDKKNNNNHYQSNNSYRNDNNKETFSPSSTHFRYGTGFNAETELQKIYLQRKNNESKSNKENKEVNNNVYEGSNLTNNYSNNNNIKVSSYNPNTKYQYDNNNTNNNNNDKSFTSNSNRKDILNDTCRTLNLPYSTSPYKVNNTSIYNNNINNNTLNNNYNCNYGSNEGKSQLRTTYNYGISSNLRNNNEFVPENYGNNYSNYGNNANTIKDNAFINSIRSAYSPYKSYSPIKPTNLESTIPTSNYNYKNYNTSTNYNPIKRLNSPQRINKNNDRFNLSPLNTMTNDFYSKYLSPTRRQQVYYSSMFNNTLNNNSRSNNFNRTNISPFRSTYKSPIRELYTQTQSQIYRSPYKSPYRSPYKTNLSTSMNNISLNNNIAYSPMSFSQRLPSPDRNQNPYSSTMPKRFALNQTKQSSSFCYVLDRILSIEMQNEKLKEINDIPGKYSLRELFRLFDTSDSGNISLIDFKKVLYNEMELFPSLDEINMLFKKFDINRDGKLK